MLTKCLNANFEKEVMISLYRITFFRKILNIFKRLNVSLVFNRTFIIKDSAFLDEKSQYIWHENYKLLYSVSNAWYWIDKEYVTHRRQKICYLDDDTLDVYVANNFTIVIKHDWIISRQFSWVCLKQNLTANK